MAKRHNKHWTQEEKDYVIDNWGTSTIRGIAKKLGRSTGSIIKFGERNQLGGAVYNDMYLTTVQAGEIIGVDQTTIIAWIKSNQLKAQFRPMRKKKTYQIDPDDFRNFLRDNQDKWKACNLQDGFFDVEVDWLIKKQEKDANPVVAKMKSPWTIKEQNTLIDLVRKGVPVKEIAEVIGRTKHSVQNKKERLQKECLI